MPKKDVNKDVIVTNNILLDIDNDPLMYLPTPKNQFNFDKEKTGN